MPRKVSLKQIVKAIDKVLEDLGPAASRKKTLSPEEERIERTKKILKGVRESVEGACLPNFDIPVP